MRRGAGTIRALAALGPVLLFPATAQAQAWVLPQGQGSVSVVYHHVFVRDHLFAGGEARDVGHIRSHVVTTDVEYALTDRLSVRALLPYVAAKYDGRHAHRHTDPLAEFEFIDDGTYHSGFQDLRAEARYGMLEFPVAIAPFVSLAVPTHDYEFFAHSAIGLKMAEFQVGAYLGGLFGPIAAQGRISHGIYERVAGRRRNRTNFDAEVGWPAGRRVRLFVFQAAQLSHGGVELPFAELPRLASEYWWPHHDRLGQAHFFNAGAGLTLHVTNALALQGSVVRTFAGSNTHAASYGLTVGTIWAFRARASKPSHQVTRRR